jgi:hypothetical protein
MAASLDDELPWVGMGTSVMADKPERIIDDDAARGRHLTRDLGTRTAPRSQAALAHAPRAIPSFRIHTFVAKKSLIIAA